MLPYQPARYLIAIVVILLIPYTAIQFTDQVAWSLGDFVVAGALLGTFALFYDLIRKQIPSKKSRIYIVTLLALTFILVWAEMVVGIFGSPIAALD